MVLIPQERDLKEHWLKWIRDYKTKIDEKDKSGKLIQTLSATDFDPLSHVSVTFFDETKFIFRHAFWVEQGDEVAVFSEHHGYFVYRKDFVKSISGADPKQPPIARTLVELYSTADRWTQETFAKDSHGFSTTSFSDAATCFCLKGGITRVYGGGVIGGPRSQKVDEVYKLVAAACDERLKKEDGKTVSGCPIAKWNDKKGRTQGEVLELVKELNV